ncbi:MAG: FAD:protein FMN transferase [Oscillospiraceae bacterium]|nr:FAD:protein FMN transferase [Oscillospiraceae bacterium]
MKKADGTRFEIKCRIKNLKNRRVRGSHKAVTALFVCIFMIISGIGTAGCGGGQSGDIMSETRLLFDTYCTITIGQPIYSSKLDASNLISNLLEEAFELCEKYEALFGMTVTGSDVWKINHAKGEPVEVSRETVELIEHGLRFGELSGGMFDITVGRLSSLWDFGNNFNEHGGQTVPPQELLKKAQLTVNYSQLTTNAEKSTVQLENPESWIDLGGIAKGYIADKIAEHLRQNGVTNALINLGGDIMLLGKRPDGSPWRTAIRKPYGSENEYVGVLEIADASIVSSGTYERQFTEDGITYHHILDPYTGMPSTSDVISATVIAENALIGESLSTIAVLTGSEKIEIIFEQTAGFIGAVLVTDGGEVLIYGNAELIT